MLLCHHAQGGRGVGSDYVVDIQLLLNFLTEPLASLLIRHPIRPTKVPHCHGDLETHRHNDIAHPQIICIIVVVESIK